MLHRIEEIQGIGLLHDANGKPFGCHKATLVYADNGRGKSTLATILRSVSTGNAILINGWKTVDGTLPPKAILQFDNGLKVSFSNGSWSEQRPELVVFDADFVGRNVHSGGIVSTDHRKNLLEFALGEAAVTARADLDDATTKAKNANDDVQSLSNQLSGYHLGLTLTQFEQLAQVPAIDAKIADLQARISAASNIAAIQARPVPKKVPEPVFDIDGLFSGLALSLADVHANAEQVVKQHIEKLGKNGAEIWLSQGQQFSDGETCPYCDQNISANTLVLAYQTHFNAAYNDLKSKVSALHSAAMTGSSPNVIEGLARNFQLAAAQAAAWVEQAPIQPVSFGVDADQSALTEFRERVLSLTQRKIAAPAESIGSPEEKAELGTLWQQVIAPVLAANAEIETAEQLINAYKSQLSGDSVPQLQQQLFMLQAAKRRYETTVIDLFVKIVAARLKSQQAATAKQTARDTLDSLMTATLTKYQTSINALLKNFGASFSIKDMGANFRGNAPRSEYGLLLRGKSISLEGGPPSFSTALSEGDKRTLAFAFFIASTIEDPKLTTRIVVVDDPMSSLDANRRHNTQTVLNKIHAKAQQLIVFAHDPYFLRDLRDALHKADPTVPISQFQLVATQNNYTTFAALDIDKECESVYVRNHRLLTDYSAGSGGDAKTVADAIRPMLEGYLHRRFPGLIPKDAMFGPVVTLIRDSVQPSPLCHAKNLVDELNQINDYAGGFHHDPNAGGGTSAVTATELKNYVDRALCVVHKGAPA
jgi:wobble nucleotide-excising tRNase